MSEIEALYGELPPSMDKLPGIDDFDGWAQIAQAMVMASEIALESYPGVAPAIALGATLSALYVAGHRDGAMAMRPVC